MKAPLANLTETMVQNGAATLVRPETSLPPMSLKASPSPPRTDKRASQFERGKCLRPLFSYAFPLGLIVDENRRSRITDPLLTSAQFMYLESITALSNLRHKVLAVIDSV